MIRDRSSRVARALCTVAVSLVAARAIAAQTPVPVGREARIAVLPMVNLSAKRAPMDELRALLGDHADLRGLETLRPAELETFMSSRRMRYTGGVDSATAVALRESTGAQAVLISALHSYDEADPPTFAIVARLVTTESDPRIVWMAEVSLTGDQTPGLLALGLVRDVATLRDRAFEQLFDSLVEQLGSAEPPRVGRLKAKNRFRPKRFYRTPQRPESDDAAVRVAVLPFI
ncbi:MAG TPA: hypothetical protein VD788_07695, partial [Candidatus Polarisedimenticolaceae bacterium]|nr:hypothetical protein [Candidatus Polarisedimenticolaceae bacterium]